MNECMWIIDRMTLTGENQSIWRKTTAKLFTTNPMPDLTWASASTWHSLHHWINFLGKLIQHQVSILYPE